jgi:hypothetical protein
MSSSTEPKQPDNRLDSFVAPLKSQLARVRVGALLMKHIHGNEDKILGWRIDARSSQLDSQESLQFVDDLLAR